MNMQEQYHPQPPSSVSHSFVYYSPVGSTSSEQDGNSSQQPSQCTRGAKNGGPPSQQTRPAFCPTNPPSQQTQVYLPPHGHGQESEPSPHDQLQIQVQPQVHIQQCPHQGRPPHHLRLMNEQQLFPQDEDQRHGPSHSHGPPQSNGPPQPHDPPPAQPRLQVHTQVVPQEVPQLAQKFIAPDSSTPMSSIAFAEFKPQCVLPNGQVLRSPLNHPEDWELLDKVADCLAGEQLKYYNRVVKAKLMVKRLPNDRGALAREAKTLRLRLREDSSPAVDHERRYAEEVEDMYLQKRLKAELGKADLEATPPLSWKTVEDLITEKLLTCNTWCETSVFRCTWQGVAQRLKRWLGEDPITLPSLRHHLWGDAALAKSLWDTPSLWTPPRGFNQKLPDHDILNRKLPDMLSTPPHWVAGSMAKARLEFPSLPGGGGPPCTAERWKVPTKHPSKMNLWERYVVGRDFDGESPLVELGAAQYVSIVCPARDCLAATASEGGHLPVRPSCLGPLGGGEDLQDGVGCFEQQDLFACPYIARTLGCWMDQCFIYQAVELCDGGDLLDVLKKQPKVAPSVPRRCEEEACRKIVRQLMIAVKYLHDRGVAHRDISLENVVLTTEPEDRNVRLIDLGVMCPIYKEGYAEDEYSTSALLGEEGGGGRNVLLTPRSMPTTPRSSGPTINHNAQGFFDGGCQTTLCRLTTPTDVTSNPAAPPMLPFFELLPSTKSGTTGAQPARQEKSSSGRTPSTCTPSSRCRTPSCMTTSAGADRLSCSSLGPLLASSRLSSLLYEPSSGTHLEARRRHSRAVSGTRTARTASIPRSRTSSSRVRSGIVWGSGRSSHCPPLHRSRTPLQAAQQAAQQAARQAAKKALIPRLVSGNAGKLYCQAPEMYSAPAYAPAPIDIWAVGIVLYALMTGTRLFEVPLDDDRKDDGKFLNFRRMVWKHKHGFRYYLEQRSKIEPSLDPSRFSDKLVDLLERMLAVCPEARATAEEVLQHPWFVEENLPGVRSVHEEGEEGGKKPL